MKKCVLLILGVFISCFLWGCGQQSGEAEKVQGITVTDSLGRKVVIEKTPVKIISLSPATTEILFALGLGDKIVGDTDYCDYPEEAKNKDKVGGFENPNLELIVAKEPDMVFTAAGLQEEVIKKLQEANIEVVCLDASTIEQVVDNILLAGKITATEEKAGEIVNDMQARMDRVAEKTKGEAAPTVFFEVWDDPLMTAGPGSFIDSLIKIAGGNNIASGLQEQYANFSLELLLEADPDYYLLNSHAHNPEDVSMRTGFKELKAVKGNRVFSIEDDLVTLPGPRIVQGLEEIAKIIHPELFKD